MVRNQYLQHSFLVLVLHYQLLIDRRAQSRSIAPDVFSRSQAPAWARHQTCIPKLALGSEGKLIPHDRATEGKFHDSKKIKDKKVESSEHEAQADLWVLFPEGAIALLFLLASPIQAVILLMHDRVLSCMLIMATAAATVYAIYMFIEGKKVWGAFCVGYIYLIISLAVWL